MFKKVLIANRGEISGRIVRTLRRLNIASVAVTSEADRFTRPVLDAQESILIGPAAAKESYLNVDAIIAACKATGADAVHPGYGFLSENACFAERLAAEGIAFIGPRAEHLRSFGLKHTARDIAAACGVALLPGSGLLSSSDEAVLAAAQIGYPVMLKSTAGGGGIGMQLCHSEAELRAKFSAVERMAEASFGDARVFLERFVAEARHVEVQIFGLGDGRVLTLGERDCSLQRRNQKVVEETPAPGLTPKTRARLHEAARVLGAAVNYESAGTVEFIYDVAREDFYFLEVNTRLQVEHPVTEAVLGIDLVEWMIKQAEGSFVPPEQHTLVPAGHAIEVRVYAENPQADFRPSTGLITALNWPAESRVDGWVEVGTEVTPHYDPMLAKLIVQADTREKAVSRIQTSLAATSLYGLETNLDYLSAIVAAPEFILGKVSTNVLKNFAFQSRAIDVVAPGALTSVQAWPGRLGLWPIGVPPSGPMDARSHKLANTIVGNAPDAAALECTVSGPTLLFHHATTLALTGAHMPARLDGVAVSYLQAIPVSAGQTLTLGKIEGPGQRTYLSLAGGLDVPNYLGSRATFALGKFGGHATGPLRVGDVLKQTRHAQGQPVNIGESDIPVLTTDWTLNVRSGPHGAPDFFAVDDMADLFGSAYEVHFNSARTGVRLIGSRPRWARKDGGEAGLHPSNIHDTAYAIGAIDFTGDMPIILGPDGPSLGGFVCPAVVTNADLWKLGQLKPGDTVRFKPNEGYTDGLLTANAPAALTLPNGTTLQNPILKKATDGPVDVVYRRAGDDCLLIEYGPMMLDLALRLRVHLLQQALQAKALDGIIELTPGIRSLQIHFDSSVLSGNQLIQALSALEAELPAAEDVTVPSRIVHLPLSWNDASVVLAMQKYQQLVRPDAPWCPDNIEFIRRINGLESIDAVREIVFAAEYLVMGLGDVYLGAPVATPTDPRHRLVTTKYNPARTWTPENAVGIGGAYLCIYGMEGPGGYQLFGRTIQMWNAWRTTPEFEPGHPWLLRPFDRIRFFPVSESELTEAREAFPHGRYPLQIEASDFSFKEYANFLRDNEAGIAAFKLRQQAAFEAERVDWKLRKLDSFVPDESPRSVDALDDLPEGATAISAPFSGNVWKILVAEGDRVEAGQPVLVVESMKMEMEIIAPAAGVVTSLRCQQGVTLRAGDIVGVIHGVETP